MSEGESVAHGCALLELLHDGPRSEVRRCRRLSDGAPLVMKLPARGALGAERTQALLRERDLLRELADSAAVIRLRGFEVEGGRSALLLEDFGAKPLHAWGIAGRLPLPEWLALARRLARLLGDLHGRGIVHNDVNSSNILCDSSLATVKLIDFAAACSITATLPSSALRSLHGPIAYMSPERTGRLNRSIDPRSDLYSCGVVLFELLTGRLPFPFGDPRTLVHAHLARQAPRASDFVKELPGWVNALLAKLLAKEPEQRYPSAVALIADLEQLAPESGGAAPSTSPPSPAVISNFRLSERAFGQEEVIQKLLAEQEAVHERARAVVLVGGSGSGKTTVALRFAAEENRQQGFFATGCFDQASPGPPNEAVSQVLASLSTQILGEGSARVEAWKGDLLASLGGTDKLLLEFCPALRHLLPETSARSLSAGQTRTQLGQAIVTLLDHAAELKQPRPCIFVDDVQLADADASNLLLDIVASCRSIPLLFLFAYRTDDAAGLGPERWLAKLESAGVTTQRIDLPPLTVADVAALIRDALPQGSGDVDALARLVSTRTYGNPFFVRAFLESLRSEGLLGQSLDLERINRLGVTANVAELLVANLARVPARTREVLGVAACVGMAFAEDLLELCVGPDVDRALADALALQVVLPVARDDASTAELPERRRFRFAHDKIRAAVLATLGPEAQGRIHLDIGRALLGVHDGGSFGSEVFDVARHLNAARTLVGINDAPCQLAEFNLVAARASLRRAAAVEALEFARMGVAALPNDAWSTEYELTRDLHGAGCEAAFECAAHESLAELAPPLLAHARTAVEAARIYWLQGRVLQARSRSPEAIQTFATALARLGVTLDLEVSVEQIAEERAKTEELIARRGIDALAKLPRADSDANAVAIDLLSKLVFFAYSDVSKILPVVICRLVQHSLEHGTTAETANGFTFYGLLLALDGDRKGAVRYAKAALAVAHDFGDPTNLSQTYLYTTYLLLHWRMPLADLVEPFGDAYRYGLASGSPLNTACSATTLCICRFWAGHELTRLASDMESYRRVISRFRQVRILNWQEIWMQVIDNLQHGAPDPTKLDGAFYRESERYAEHERVNDKTAIFNLNVARTFTALLFGDPETALAYSAKNRHIPPLFACSVWAGPTAFLDGLCLFACSDRADGARRAELLALGRHATERLATFLPDNPREIEPKYRLLEAELARLVGDADSARQSYVKAIDLSAGSGSPVDEALANELAGRFELRAGNRDVARQRLRASQRAYLRWGARAKARALESEFPEVFRPTMASIAAGWSLPGGASDFDLLDIASCLEASRALSSEIKLEGLLKRLMELLIETAGAQTGCLLMKRGEHWVIEAVQSAEGGTVSVLEGLPPQEVHARGIRPPEESIVNYVASTGEAVVLQDEPGGSIFPHSVRARFSGQGSVLCFAVKRQGQTLAIAYLENHLMRGAFTRSALRVLEMLSAQAAVSLENASLYAQLEGHVQARTRELRAKNDELETTLLRLTDIQNKLVTHEKLSGLATIAGGLAHEIKNPLNFIANFAEGAVETAEELIREVEAEITRFRPGKQRTLRTLMDDLRLAGSKVVEHAGRANRLVNHMSPHTSSKVELRHMDLNDLVMEGLNAAAPDFGQPDAEISIKAELAPEPVLAMFAPQDIVQVIVNLVTNAVESVKQKRAECREGYRPEVEIRTTTLADQVELRVRDNGVGVPQASQQDIFLHFFTTKAAGQGLGLSLSREIVVGVHGGELTLNSVQGEYAEFVVTLPLAAERPTNDARGLGNPSSGALRG